MSRKWNELEEKLSRLGFVSLGQLSDGRKIFAPDYLACDAQIMVSEYGLERVATDISFLNKCIAV